MGERVTELVREKESRIQRQKRNEKRKRKESGIDRNINKTTKLKSEENREKYI